MYACCRAREKLRSSMNFLISLTVALCFLIYTAPVFCGQCEIEIGPGWMEGKADGTPLGTVLTEVTRKAGFNIYIDEQLQEIPVS